jgi:hypothetical protein
MIYLMLDQLASMGENFPTLDAASNLPDSAASSIARLLELGSPTNEDRDDLNKKLQTLRLESTCTERLKWALQDRKGEKMVIKVRS